MLQSKAVPPVPMDKAYDLKVLLLRIRQRGVSIAEAGLEIMLEELGPWCEESSVLSATKADDFFVPPLVEFLTPVGAKEIDKVDGKIGNNGQP